MPDSAGDLLGGGNTITPPKQVNKAKRWFFTFNNFQEIEIGPIIETFDEKCTKWIFQEEIGESGTKHLQGNIWTIVKLRPTELKLNKKIHWELTKATDKDVIAYCSKKETATGRLWRSKGLILPKALKLIQELRPWQADVERIATNEDNADDRTIYWIYDPVGKNGKSQLAKRLVALYEALYITTGKKADIMNMAFNYTEQNYLSCVVLDLPRNTRPQDVDYSALENLIDGMICNTKYETGMRVINSPCIWVFSNMEPEWDKMTDDRFKVFTIENDELVNYHRNMTELHN